MLDIVVLSVLDVVIPIVVGIVCLGGGLVLGKYLVDTQLKKANKTADDIIEKAKENFRKTYEKKQEHPKYEEMCRRFLADAKDFTKEKIEQAGITKSFYNHFLPDCLEEIVTYIKKNA